MYYFIVLTSPEKEFHEVDALQQYCVSKFTSSLIISEMGDNGTNPHINVVVKMGSKRIDNVRRGIMASYYGPKLSIFEQVPAFNRYGCSGKCVKDVPNLKNVVVYLTKEVDPLYFFDNNMNVDSLLEGMLKYEDHKALIESQEWYVRSAEQILVELITEYKKECMEDNLNQFIENYQYPPPTKADFVRQLKNIARKGYNLTPITSKMKIYYIEFMSRLGSYDQLENLVDRVDEELNRPRN